MAGLLALAWLASENRRAVPWRAVAAGMALLLVLAVVFLKVPLVKDAFMKLNEVLLVLERATQAGTSLVFGYLGGGPAPFQVSNEASNFVLAFRALPIVLVISALSALLFYWRVLPAIVRAISFLLEKTMRIGGVVGLSTSMDALTRGTLEGAQLLLNIVATLVVFVALVALVNLVIAPYTLQGALGWVLAPLAWLAGIPWSEARAAGSLLGTKIVINELVAYLDLANMKDLSERSRLLLT